MYMELYQLPIKCLGTTLDECLKRAVKKKLKSFNTGDKKLLLKKRVNEFLQSFHILNTYAIVCLSHLIVVKE